MMIRFGSHRQGDQSRADFFQQNRPEVPTVYPDIQALRVAGEIAVAVPVEMQRAVMRAIPNTEPVVAKYDRRIADLDMKEAVDRRPSLGFLDSVGPIMIADDEPFLAFEAREVRRVIGKGEVTEMVHQVARRDAFIPARNHRLVHFID